MTTIKLSNHCPEIIQDLQHALKDNCITCRFTFIPDIFAAQSIDAIKNISTGLGQSILIVTLTLGQVSEFIFFGEASGKQIKATAKDAAEHLTHGIGNLVGTAVSPLLGTVCPTCVIKLHNADYAGNLIAVIKYTLAFFKDLKEAFTGIPKITIKVSVRRYRYIPKLICWKKVDKRVDPIFTKRQKLFAAIIHRHTAGLAVSLAVLYLSIHFYNISVIGGVITVSKGLQAVFKNSSPEAKSTKV